MGLLLRIFLGLCVFSSAAWFGGYLQWLWLLLVGLPSTNPELALQAAIEMEASSSRAVRVFGLGVTTVIFGTASCLCWVDHRPAASALLAVGASVQVVCIAIALSVNPTAQIDQSWARYSAQEATVAALFVLMCAAGLAISGIAIWTAGRSHFVREDM